MFGGAAKGVKKTKSVIHPMKCSLEDLYSGKKIRIKITHDRNCKDCNGKGAKNNGNNSKC
jgi:DnaJ family protein A protein 2